MQQPPTYNLAPNNKQHFTETSYEVAIDQDTLEQTFELVWKSYTKVGLHPEDGLGKRITKYHLLPNTKVFVATKWVEINLAGKSYFRKKVIGTLTVVHDECLGLPSEEVCKKEIVALRKNGGRTAEFIGLACNQEGIDQRVPLKLFRLAYEYCSRNNITGIIAALTTRHIGYYRRFLGFSPLGELANYKHGNGTPVQAHYVHLESGRSLFERRTNILFKEDDWHQFWRTHSNCVIQEASKARPWKNETIKRFIQLCPQILEQIDIHTASALYTEYKRFDLELCLTP